MSISCNVSKGSITVEGNITVRGSDHPIVKNTSVTLLFTTPNGSVIKQYAYTNSNGFFTATFKPNSLGSWRVQTKLEGDDLRCETYSELKSFRVNDAWINQYNFYIMGAVVAVVGFW
jgi:uncharacterized protein YfaS (alpha-2-macroglobulin family)